MAGLRRKIEKTEDIIHEMNYIYQVSQRLLETKPLHLLLDEIMDSCKTLMNAEASSLLMYDEKDNKLYFQVATGEKGKLIKEISFPVGEGIAGWVAHNREALLIEDCYKDSRFNPEFDKQSNFKTKSMICVPMIHKEKLIGVIQVINKRNDEVFVDRDLHIFRILAAQCAIAIENARLIEVQILQEALNRELKIARDIQQNLLPSVIPEFNDILIAAALIPAKQIGGDYFNIYKINDGQTLFFVCDVSGKSISAALIVSTIYSTIVTYFELRDNFDLIEFVKCLNRVLIESTTSEKYATCWFGLYNHTNRLLTSVNAGHHPTLVFKNDKSVIELKKGGLILGAGDFDFEYEEIKLEHNDLVLFYTDGIPEAMNKEMKFYGVDRLVNFIKGNKDLNTGIIIEMLLEDIRSFVKDADQSDDITCGLIRIIDH